MKNREEKDFYKRKRRKYSAKNVTEDVVYDELFISKTSDMEHDRKMFIADSGVMSHMVNSEENITNLKDSETRVTVGDSRTIARTKRVN